MSVKKQIPSLCKLYPIYEELLEEFLDETGVDSYFYHNILDVSQSQHRIVRVSRGSNKNSFAIKLFQFCDLKTPQPYILEEEMKISRREITCLVDSLRDFLQTFDHASKIYRFPYRNSKLRLYLQSQKTISLLITVAISLNNQIDKLVHRSVLETTIRLFFPAKSLNYMAINLTLQKMSSLTTAKFTTVTRTDVTLQTSAK